MTADPRTLAARGYDLIAEAYLERFGRSQVRDRWLRQMIARLPQRARVLDLGCGAGLPVARVLAAQGFQVVGVDGSARQIELAVANVPEGQFILADMTEVEFAPASFDAISAFYAITHIPRQEHATLLRRIAAWLKPGGVFVGSFGADDLDDWRGQWLGTEIFFSHYSAQTNERLAHEAGLLLEKAEVVPQDNEDARFLWMVARTPGQSPPV
jgi:cyclopropane fatty-acyl-phospholipid synthase-like methyltransferase